MPATKLPLAAATDELLYPEYWLVSGLRWPGDGPNARGRSSIRAGTHPARRPKSRCLAGPGLR